MGKTVKDLLADVGCGDDLDGGYAVLALFYSERAEDSSVEGAVLQSVVRVAVDSQNRELLCFLADKNEANSAIALSALVDAAEEKIQDFQVCLAKEDTIDGNYIRIDIPIIGFGENHVQRRYLLVASSDAG